MRVLVIHEIDLDDQEQIVIGVADSVEAANKIIDQYYGKYKEISFLDIRDSNLECSKIIEIPSFSDGSYQCKVILVWFEINKI